MANSVAKKCSLIKFLFIISLSFVHFPHWIGVWEKDSWIKWWIDFSGGDVRSMAAREVPLISPLVTIWSLKAIIQWKILSPTQKHFWEFCIKASEGGFSEGKNRGRGKIPVIPTQGHSLRWPTNLKFQRQWGQFRAEGINTFGKWWEVRSKSCAGLPYGGTSVLNLEVWNLFWKR